MHFSFETRVDRPRNDVFRFFSDPNHLTLIYRGNPAFRMLRHDGNIVPGSQTWIQVTALAILPIVLGFVHEHYEPPTSFSEKLIHGPFRRFDHRHEFHENGGSTIVRDTLHLELPATYGGRLSMSLLVRSLVNQMFQIRQARTVRLLEDDDNRVW